SDHRGRGGRHPRRARERDRRGGAGAGHRRRARQGALGGIPLMIGVGVIGYGYWGPNLVRNFAETPGCRVAAVADMRPHRLDVVRARYPAVETHLLPVDLIADPKVDAVAIATPISTHFDLAMQALKAGKHVLVEKPITARSEDALRLIEEADRRGLV